MKLFDYGEETLPRVASFCLKVVIGVALVSMLITFIVSCVFGYLALQFLMNWI